jgi:hypothetical protein
MTTSQSITPSAVFGLVSYTIIASGTHPRIYKSYTDYLRSTPGPKSSINARPSLSGSPRTLRSPAKPGPGQRSRLQPGQPQSSSGAQHCQPAVSRRNHPSSGIPPPGSRQRHKGKRSWTDTTAAQILLFVSRRRLHSPNNGLSGDQGHQRQNVQSTTGRQPEGSSAHIPSTTTLPQRANPASTQPRLPAPRGPGPTTPPPHHQNPPHHHHPQAPKQEDFTEPPYQGVIHMITRGSSVDFDTKQQKKDHYRSVNYVALTSPVVQTKWSHVPLTFDARDIDLRNAPHTDALVINCSVGG